MEEMERMHSHDRITLNEYQEQAARTAIYPYSDQEGYNFINEGHFYTGLGLAGEAGEVAEKLKKVVRDNDGLIDGGEKGKLVRELGDVLWYVSELSRLLGVDLGQVAQANLTKLSVRQDKDLLSGTGDFRENPLPQSVGEAIARDPQTGTGRQLPLPEVGSFGDEVDPVETVEERRNREIL